MTNGHVPGTPDELSMHAAACARNAAQAEKRGGSCPDAASEEGGRTSFMLSFAV